MNPLGAGLQSCRARKRESWEEMEKLRDSEGGDKRLKKGSGNCCLGTLFTKFVVLREGHVVESGRRKRTADR